MVLFYKEELLVGVASFQVCEMHSIHFSLKYFEMILGSKLPTTLSYPFDGLFANQMTCEICSYKVNFAIKHNNA